jgi:hypothetical protein
VIGTAWAAIDHCSKLVGLVYGLAAMGPEAALGVMEINLIHGAMIVS